MPKNTGAMIEKQNWNTQIKLSCYFKSLLLPFIFSRKKFKLNAFTFSVGLKGVVMH